MASFCSSVASSLNSRVTLKSSGPPSVRAWSLAISVTRTAVASSSDSLRLELALDGGGLLVADVEVGVRGPGERVGRRRDESRLLGWHRLELGDDPPDRGGVAGRIGGRSGAGRGAMSGSGAGLDPKKRLNMRAPLPALERGMVGTDGDERAAACGGDDATDGQFGVDDDPIARRLDRARRAAGAADRPASGGAAGSRSRRSRSRADRPGRGRRIRRIAAVQFAWQSSSVPMIPPLRTSSKAAWCGSGCQSRDQLAAGARRPRGSRSAGPARWPGRSRSSATPG